MIEVLQIEQDRHPAFPLRLVPDLICADHDHVPDGFGSGTSFQSSSRSWKLCGMFQRGRLRPACERQAPPASYSG